MIQQSAISLLRQLSDTLQQLTDEEFKQALPLLSDNSIGKHVRHIVEFYDMMLQAQASGKLSYEHRKHDPLLESNKGLMLKKIDQICQALAPLDPAQLLWMDAEHSQADSGEGAVMQTSMGREIAYNIDHTVHHIAILKIAMRHYFPHIALPPHFGVAYSTIRFQKS